MNKNIIDYYENQIKNYEKIKYEDAKKMLKECIDKDENTQRETFDKVFKGTLYLVINYIKHTKYELLNGYSFDLNDIVNCVYTLWYKKISSFELLKYEDSTKILSVNFSNEIVNELIPSESEINYMYPINQATFIDMLYLYINMRNNNISVSYKEFVDKYMECYKNDNIYFHLQHGDGYCNQKLIDSLERIYLDLSENDKKNVDINKLSIKKINKLLLYNSKHFTLKSEYQDKTEFEEKVTKEMIFDQINELLFDSDLFSDEEKDILAMFWGLNGYNHRYTLETIGHKYGYTKERISQIVAFAIRILRNNHEMNEIGKSFK